MARGTNIKQAIDDLFKKEAHTDVVFVRCASKKKKAMEESWKSRKLEPDTAAIVFANDIFNAAAARRAQLILERNRRKNIPSPSMNVVSLY